MKNTLEEIISGVDDTEGRISKLKKKKKQRTQAEQKIILLKMDQFKKILGEYQAY